MRRVRDERWCCRLGTQSGCAYCMYVWMLTCFILLCTVLYVLRCVAIAMCVWLVVAVGNVAIATKLAKKETVQEKDAGGQV